MTKAPSSDASRLERRPYRYVIYIDEAGDDSLRSVRPLDPNGGTEWFILSAVVMRAEHENAVGGWVREILNEAGLKGKKDLHFNRLTHDQKNLACHHLAHLPIRCFAIVSNKKNMRGHTNPRAAKISSRNPFYCWMGRLLLERATQYCGKRNAKEGTHGSKVKIELSEMARMSYGQLRAYLHWIRLQSAGGSLFLNKGDLDWSVVDIDLIDAYPHKTRAGLMLADVVASAFYQAVNTREDGTCRPGYAKLLRSRMATKNGSASGFGVMPLPFRLSDAGLTEAQKEIFHFYDCPTG